jgi:DNA polymerase IV (DinB-like DNA polymerase)
MKLYASVSANIMEILKGFAEKFQQVSVNEAYLVPGPEIRNFEEAAIYALRIKDEVKRQERITCSVGVDQTSLLQRSLLDIKNLMGLQLLGLMMSEIFYFP